MSAIALCVFALCAVATASPTDLKHQNDLVDHFHHLTFIADFPCHTPVPRVVSVHHLFSEHELHGKAYYPDVTVLHRCDDCAASGYCMSGHHCVAHTIDHVHLPFKVTFLHDIAEHHKGSWIFEYHTFVNHTSCHCADIHHHEHEHLHEEGHHEHDLHVIPVVEHHELHEVAPWAGWLVKEDGTSVIHDEEKYEDRLAFPKVEPAAQVVNTTYHNIGDTVHF